MRGTPPALTHLLFLPFLPTGSTGWRRWLFFSTNPCQRWYGRRVVRGAGRLRRNCKAPPHRSIVESTLRCGSKGRETQPARDDPSRDDPGACHVQRLPRTTQQRAPIRRRGPSGNGRRPTRGFGTRGVPGHQRPSLRAPVRESAVGGHGQLGSRGQFLSLVEPDTSLRVGAAKSCRPTRNWDLTTR